MVLLELLLVLTELSVLGLVFCCSSLVDLLILLFLNFLLKVIDLQDQILVVLMSVYEQPRNAYTYDKEICKAKNRCVEYADYLQRED
jgi:hypothetical protein